jgi:hypothetical protein
VLLFFVSGCGERYSRYNQEMANVTLSAFQLATGEKSSSVGMMTASLARIFLYIYIELLFLPLEDGKWKIDES